MYGGRLHFRRYNHSDRIILAAQHHQSREADAIRPRIAFGGFIKDIVAREGVSRNRNGAIGSSELSIVTIQTEECDPGLLGAQGCKLN